MSVSSLLHICASWNAKNYNFYNQGNNVKLNPAVLPLLALLIYWVGLPEPILPPGADKEITHQGHTFKFHDGDTYVVKSSAM